jgi:molybdopterin-binding protein
MIHQLDTRQSVIQVTFSRQSAFVTLLFAPSVVSNRIQRSRKALNFVMHIVRQYSEEASVKLSARNILKGTIVEVTKGQTTAHVRLDVGSAIITASITNEAVDDLKLAKGGKASAVIKASDVMIVVD